MVWVIGEVSSDEIGDILGVVSVSQVEPKAKGIM